MMDLLIFALAAIGLGGVVVFMVGFAIGWWPNDMGDD